MATHKLDASAAMILATAELDCVNHSPILRWPNSPMLAAGRHSVQRSERNMFKLGDRVRQITPQPRHVNGLRKASP
jgi:hypothetical protein